MLDHIINKFFAAPRDIIFKPLYKIIISFPSFVRKSISQAKENLKNLRYAASHVVESNLQLGIYYLSNSKFTDAIFRFKFIDKLLDPGNEIANYWLGWTYFLLNKDTKAIKALTKTEFAGNDSKDLLSFIQNIKNVTTIPSPIIETHRDLTAGSRMEQFIDAEINVPGILVATLDVVIAEPRATGYKILELGSNLGLLGMEVKSLMEGDNHLTGIETSGMLIKSQELTFPEVGIYDRLIQTPIRNFLAEATDKYEVIVSLDGLSYDADLQDNSSKIYALLQPGGYFALCLPTAKTPLFSRKQLQFIYQPEETNNLLQKIGFETLYTEELHLKNGCTFSIFILVKK